MNLKHLFKTLVFSLLVVVFAACDEPQKQGEVSYTVKYDGKTVRENDVIVVTMDDFDATSPNSQFCSVSEFVSIIVASTAIDDENLLTLNLRVS